jgi:hypothetical protein
MGHSNKIRGIFGLLLILVLLVSFNPAPASAFTLKFVDQYNYDSYDQAGFFSGVWHGLIAPWSLLVQPFNSDIGMYAYDNTGWFYNLGFLIGIIGSIPIGWAAAIIALIAFLF